MDGTVGFLLLVVLSAECADRCRTSEEPFRTKTPRVRTKKAPSGRRPIGARQSQCFNCDDLTTVVHVERLGGHVETAWYRR